MYSNVCNLFVCFNDDDYDNDCILYLAIRWAAGALQQQ